MPEIKSKFGKKFFLIAGAAVLLGLAGLVFGLNRQKERIYPAGAQWQQYSSSSLGFTLKYPSGWEVKETDAASGPDVLVLGKNGTAVVRLRAFLDPYLDSEEAITSSFADYRRVLALQDGVTISDFQSDEISDGIGGFSAAGEFPVGGAAYRFEERGQLTIWGQALIIRAADIPDEFNDSIPVMRQIVNSFKPQSATTFHFGARPAYASPQGPLTVMGNVTYNSIGTGKLEGDPASFYGNFLEGNLVNAGVPVQASGEALENVKRLREENNQMNQGRGGLFDGQYKKYEGNLPEPKYRIDANISVTRARHEGGGQDITVTVRIVDRTTGALVGQTTEVRRNADPYANLIEVGPKPSWWQRHISGYTSEIKYDDPVRGAIDAASRKVVAKLTELGGQKVESDADRFAKNIAEHKAGAVDTSDNVTATAWGGPNEWETAYEAYFWLHLQDPEAYPSFWDAYNNSGISRILQELPLGAPVNLEDYYSDPKVRDYHEWLRTEKPNVISLAAFLNSIDQYQANLDLAKPPEEEPEQPEETPADTTMSEDEARYREWLECIGRPRAPGEPTGCGGSVSSPNNGASQPNVNWTVPR